MGPPQIARDCLRRTRWATWEGANPRIRLGWVRLSFAERMAVQGFMMRSCRTAAAAWRSSVGGGMRPIGGSAGYFAGASSGKRWLHATAPAAAAAGKDGKADVFDFDEIFVKNAKWVETKRGEDTRACMPLCHRPIGRCVTVTVTPRRKRGVPRHQQKSPRERRRRTDGSLPSRPSQGSRLLQAPCDFAAPADPLDRLRRRPCPRKHHLRARQRRCICPAQHCKHGGGNRHKRNVGDSVRRGLSAGGALPPSPAAFGHSALWNVKS